MVDRKEPPEGGSFFFCCIIELSKGKAKMSENENKVVVGPGIFTMLFITFLVLKLTKVIDWSWWWITAPLWIPTVVFLTLVLGLSVICAVFSKSPTRPGRFF